MKNKKKNKKNKKKNQKKANFLNILKINQKVLTIFGLISILKNLVIWQKKVFEIKDKKKNSDFVKEIKNRWSKLKDRIEEMSEEEIENEGLNKMFEIIKEIQQTKSTKETRYKNTNTKPNG